MKLGPLLTSVVCGFLPLALQLFASACGGPPQVASSAQANPQDIQVGVTGRLDRLEVARAAGFDYIELATSEIARLSEEEFQTARQRIREVGLPVPVMNLFIPGDIKVTGPEIDAEAQMAYVLRAFDRASQLGVEHIVFGSGGARRVPDGFPGDEAFAQLVEFATRIAPAAQARGITILVEPLRRQETNIINSAREALQWVRAVDHPNFQLMIDYFHLASENEDPQIILEAREYIHHLHMANPEGRRFPRSWDEHDYAPFFQALRQIGYRGRISIEAGVEDLEVEGPMAIAMMRQAFDPNFPLPGGLGAHR